MRAMIIVIIRHPLDLVGAVVVVGVVVVAAVVAVVVVVVAVVVVVVVVAVDIVVDVVVWTNMRRGDCGRVVGVTRRTDDVC